MLSEDKRSIALSTISSNSFYYVILDHILKNIPMSVVRMGDGERLILEDYKNGSNSLKNRFNDEWINRMGLVDIDIEYLANSLIRAANTCTYFAPNINGLVKDNFYLYEYFNKRDIYIDNFFVNYFSQGRINLLYREAKTVAILNRNDDILHSFLEKSDTQITYLPFKITNWNQYQEVAEQVIKSKAKLVLVSGYKELCPYISTNGSTICLDIGNSMEQWIPTKDPITDYTIFGQEY